MRTKMKTVYYCEFCRKHGLLRRAMELHESICTLNPYRRCRWKSISGGEHGMAWSLRTLVRRLKENGDGPVSAAEIDLLRDQVDGCPACMLAALRQCGRDYHHTVDGAHLWEYTEEVERFRKEEREDWERAEAVW